jgi:hypothetical protein
LGKWCKNKHGASKIIDTFETYQRALPVRCTCRHRQAGSRCVTGQNGHEQAGGARLRKRYDKGRKKKIRIRGKITAGSPNFEWLFLTTPSGAK